MSLKQTFLAALCGILTLASSQAFAATLATEDFSYPDGSLVPNGGWQNHSGTVGDLLVSGGQAVVQHGVPSEDASIVFAEVSTGVLTATFDVTVNDETVIGTDDSGGSGTDFEYFAHFFTTGSFNFRSRVDLVRPNGAGDYTFGISSTSSDTEAFLSTDFNFGDVVPVSLSFNLDTGVGSLTVGAETIVGTSASLGETLDRFALRQSDSTNNETVLIDNLVVTGTPDIPEPASLALMVAGLVGVSVVRRK